MNRKLILSAAALTTLAVATCFEPAFAGAAPNSASNMAGQAVAKAQDVTAGAVGMASASMPTDAQGFVTAAATSDIYEIKAAKIAEARSTSPKVKAFAQKMIHDHSATTAEVKAILAKGGAPHVTPPTGLDHRRSGMIANLNKAPADRFDKVYLDQQVAAHKEAETLMKGFGEHGDNLDLKDFAAKTAPKVQMHLDMAKTLDDAAKAMPDKTPG